MVRPPKLSEASPGITLHVGRTARGLKLCPGGMSAPASQIHRNHLGDFCRNRVKFGGKVSGVCFNCPFVWVLLKPRAVWGYLESGAWGGPCWPIPALWSQDMPTKVVGWLRDRRGIDSEGHSSADDRGSTSWSRVQVYHINETRGLLKKISSVLQKITAPIQPKVAEHRPQTTKRLSYPFSREKQHL